MLDTPRDAEGAVVESAGTRPRFVEIGGPTDWILDAVEALKALRIEHRNFRCAVRGLQARMFATKPGEIILVVGPSRVGKSEAVREAIRQALGITFPADTMPAVIVEAENASTNGEFSTKAFMRDGCQAIRHPIYGVPVPDDPWGYKSDALIHKTSEQMLRNAFERGLIHLRARYVVFDEAHHIRYLRGGHESATAVLESWKNLAFKTGTVLILVGSYELLDLIAAAPHLIGRGRPLEFPRYRADSYDDVVEFEKLLRAMNSVVRCEAGASLSSWNEFIYTHSMGCIGHLSIWLRTALGEMLTRGQSDLSLDILKAARLPSELEAKILRETLAGESAVATFNENPGLVGGGDASNGGGSGSSRGKSTRSKPFQAHSRRYPRDGRA